MIDRERVKLLFGPYKAPTLKNGERAFCLYRECAVVVTIWTDAPIPWPRCYYAAGRARGCGVLVDEELVRAIKHESAAAIMYWWGVSRNTLGRWRKAFNVGRKDNEGTHRLVLGAIQANMDTRHRGGRVWSPEETALLGALPDGEVARRTGRTTNAVTVKRRVLGRAAVKGKKVRPETGRRER